MRHRNPSDVTTHGIRVRASSAFLPDRSAPEEQRYAFAYRIVIYNVGSEAVQLLSRHWIIINADGRREDVQGDGVVGETPTLEPGESFSYTSYCPLGTSWGTMEGAYTFADAKGEKFEAAIGRFFLVGEVETEAETA